MPRIDTAAERTSLMIWQQLGRSAARQFWDKKGVIWPRTPKNKRRKMRVAYIDGWNSEMRFIAATCPLPTEALFDG